MSDVWVKVKLPGELHEKFRRWVFDNDTSMQVSIVSAVKGMCGLRAGGTDGDAQRGGSIPRSKTVKLAAETVKVYSETNSESKNPAPSPTPPAPVSVPPKVKP